MSTSDPVIAILGRGVVPIDAAGVRVDDIGLTRGDGCFDSMRLVRDATGTHVDHREAHLTRFCRSAKALDLPPIDLDAWNRLIDAAISAWEGSGSAVCRVMVTRGPEFTPTPGPTGVVAITVAPPAGTPLRVVTLTTGRAAQAFTGAPWLLGGVKSVSYAVNVAARREAGRRGADDAIFVSADGYLLEGPTSGLLVARNGVLSTTPADGTGILESVTLEVILRSALAHGFGVRHRLIDSEELHLADGAWLVSAIRGVCPIVAVDGRSLTLNPRLTPQLAAWAGFGAQ